MKEQNVSSSPKTPRVDALAAEVKARAGLGQFVWEASQFMSFEEIREYVESVLREIESDEP